MMNAIKFVDTVINTAVKEYELIANKMLDFPMASDYIIFKLDEELEKTADKNVIKQLKKEIYGFEHTDSRTFALNHDDVTEEELVEDLVENCEYSEEEAKLFAEQVRTYRNL